VSAGMLVTVLVVKLAYLPSHPVDFLRDVNSVILNLTPLNKIYLGFVL
jgi:hypothetical protein